MKFTESITIALARDRVIALLDSLENLALWQPDLLETRQLEGEYRQAGAKTELRYKMGKKELVMVETIVERTLPDAIVVNRRRLAAPQNLLEALGQLPEASLDSSPGLAGPHR